jgi:hypothetical protein
VHTCCCSEETLYYCHEAFLAIIIFPFSSSSSPSSYHLNSLTSSSTDFAARYYNMKVSTALCALSLGSWTLAAPIVVFKNEPPKYSGVQITRIPVTPASADTWPIRTHKFTTTQDATAQDALNGRPDNRPYSPTSDVAPSEALAAPRPLKTSYLLSIRPFASHSSENESPDAASASSSQSPHSEFQDSSIVEAETGSVKKHHHFTTVELETLGNKPNYQTIPCPKQSGYFHLVKGYTDTTVVAVVFILIAVIALIELWNPICRQ